jgi:hypothetical protein
MAKKRPVPKKAAKPARSAKAAKAMKNGPKPAPKPQPGTSAVVVFTLRDSGASALRFHSEHEDVQRAKGMALSLANSPDVADAFVLTNVEIVRRSELG